MACNILTQRNGRDRRGVNGDETILRPDNVNLNAFGQVGHYSVDGDVYAQPLYVPKVGLPGGGMADLLIVATMNNSVYAFDTKVADPAKAQVWHVNVGPSVFAPQFAGGSYRDIVDSVDDKDYRKHTSTIGILSTPVIDADIDPAGAKATTGTIYLVSFTGDQAAFEQTKSADEFKHFLHALDLADGKPVLGPVQIQGSMPGQGYYVSESNDLRNKASVVWDITVGKIQTRVVDCDGSDSPASATVRFNSIMQLQRPGLLLQQGCVVIAFGSRGDEDPYHGWIFAYDAATFELVGLHCTTPNGAQGGIWQAGQGLLTDSKGNIYAGTGNGDSIETVTVADLQGRNLGESFVQLRLDPKNTGLRVTGWFNAFDDFTRSQEVSQTYWANPDDDLGASAPALLPDDRVVGGGKDGWFYLIDPDLLDKAGSPNAVPQAFKASFNFARGTRNTVDSQSHDNGTHHIHGTPVVWTSALGTFVYVWGENDVVRVFQYAPEINGDPTTGRFVGQDAIYNPAKQPRQGTDFARGNVYASNEDPPRKGMPGGMLSLSWDGSDPASAILWAAFPPYHNGNEQAVPGALAAYDASGFDDNLAFKRLTLLWSSEQNSAADRPGLFGKFCCPTIAAGRAYLATVSKRVVIYGPKAADGGYRLGFGGVDGLCLNGSAATTGTGGIALTDLPHPPSDGNAPTFNAGSFFSRAQVDVTRFVTEWTFRMTDAVADGLTFTIQAEGPHAIGSPGSGLGYRPDLSFTTLSTLQDTITHSFAVALLPGTSGNVVTSQLALLLNGGQYLGFVNVDLRQGPDLLVQSGNLITVRLRYDGNHLFIQLSDPVRQVTTQDFQLLAGNIAQQIHALSGKAWVGFTGGTGSLAARHEITAWRFQPGTFA